MTYLLTCTKTGRFWHLGSFRECRQSAARHGLTDYTIENDRGDDNG